MQNTIKIEKLVSVMAFAKMKAVSRQTVYNWIKAKQIMSVMIGGKTFVMP
jgi:predicted DNA-binding transcriptional regulator AlpA